MILSKNKILEEYNNNKIIYKSDKNKIEDYAKNQSVDIHLGDWMYVEFINYGHLWEFMQMNFGWQIKAPRVGKFTVLQLPSTQNRYSSQYHNNNIDNEIEVLENILLSMERSDVLPTLELDESNLAFWLPPRNWKIPHNTFVLAHTEEYIGTSSNSNIHPEFHQRSTTARMGLSHTKAGWGDNGFCNRWALELYTLKDVTITAGMKIGQISFAYTTDSEVGYSEQTGNYQSSNNIDEIIKNWKKEDILPKEGNV